VSKITDSGVEMLSFVKEIVVDALRANPATDAAELSRRLLASVGWSSAACIKDEPAQSKEEPSSSVEYKTVAYTTVESVAIVAPYPESAIGGDSYDPIQATECLPEFEKLPFEFCKEHSVIRSGEQTVVMNSAHYADLLSLRQIAVQANKYEQLWRSVAETSVRELSDLSHLLTTGEVLLQSCPEGVRISYVSEGRDSVSQTHDCLRSALQAMVEEVRARELLNLLNINPVSVAEVADVTSEEIEF
jgi:hypothetical protein